MDANLAVDLGAYVASVVSNGVAADGIEDGDVIVQNDNTPVTDAQSLGEALATYNPVVTPSLRTSTVATAT